MSNFVPNSHNLREVLLHHFISMKTAAESHRILVNICGEHTLSETTCRDWFRRFKSADFDLSNKDRGKPPKNLEMQNCKHWELTKELFPDAYRPLERSRKKKNGCRTN